MLGVKIVSFGSKAIYNDSIILRIPKLKGKSECEFKAIVDLTVNQTTWAKPPITIDFEIVMYAASGIAVKYLKYGFLLGCLDYLLGLWRKVGILVLNG